jgi:hypothetical protein
MVVRVTNDASDGSEGSAPGIKQTSSAVSRAHVNALRAAVELAI